MHKPFFKKILSSLLVTIFISAPAISFAEVNTTGAPRAIIVDEGKTYAPVGLQTSQANSINSTTGGVFNPAGAAGSFLSCAGAGAISNAIKGAITNSVSKVTNLFDVPTSDSQQRAKESGTTVLGAIPLPSWDQAGWCLVNSIIESIGDATVAWINGGFQGNPVFVEDPGQFFADIADIQAGAFINELSGGFLCEPIKNIVRINLASNYNAGIGGYAPQCTFTGVAGNLEQFMAGDSFSWADWNSFTQEPYNNPYGATLYGQIELDSRIAGALGIQSNILDWGAGFLSSKDPQTGKITTPGATIEKQINERLGSGQRRLEIADEFDEVVNALVNQLIKVAITEMTQVGGQSDSSATSYNYGNYNYANVDQGTPPPVATTTKDVTEYYLRFTMEHPMQGDNTSNLRRGYNIGDTVKLKWEPGSKMGEFSKYKVQLENWHYGRNDIREGLIVIANNLPKSTQEYSFKITEELLQELHDKADRAITKKQANMTYQIKVYAMKNNDTITAFGEMLKEPFLTIK